MLPLFSNNAKFIYYPPVFNRTKKPIEPTKPAEPKMKLNKIYCQDCIEGMKQLADYSIDLIVTDPPYNISGLTKGNELHDTPINSDFGEWDYNFNPEQFLAEAKRVLKPDGQIYVFSSDRLMGKYIDLFAKLRFHYRNNIVWIKTNPLPKIRQQTWRLGTEYILYAGACKADKLSEYTFNWLGQEEMKNTIFCPTVSGKKRTAHPTQKPLSIIQKLIRVSSNENDLVFDPFMGSGTTAVACRQLDRQFIGFETSSDYCDIANKRLSEIPKKLDKWM